MKVNPMEKWSTLWSKFPIALWRNGRGPYKGATP